MIIFNSRESLPSRSYIVSIYLLDVNQTDITDNTNNFEAKNIEYKKHRLKKNSGMYI